MPEDYSFDAQLLANMRRLKALLPCCPNCEHFATVVKQGTMTTSGVLETVSEACALDPERRRPPANIIAFGCPAFKPGVPF